MGGRGQRIEVVVDHVAALEGSRVASSFAEVEAEVVKGDGAGLEAVEKALRKAGAKRGDDEPKLARVLGLEPQPAMEQDDSVGRLRALLVEQYETMLANDPGVRLGEDPEALHHLRVATRRSRALLRAARGLIAPDWAEPLRVELAWLGGLLGPVRDLDVLLEHLDAEAGGWRVTTLVPFAACGRARRREEEGRSLLEAMGTGGPRVPRPARGRGRAPAGDLQTPLAEIAGGAYARLRKAVKTLPKRPTDDELHRVRIETKRARYASELAARELGKAGGKFVERAKECPGRDRRAPGRVRRRGAPGGLALAAAADRAPRRPPDRAAGAAARRARRPTRGAGWKAAPRERSE